MKALLILLSPLWFTTAHAWTSIQSQTPFLRNKQMTMSYQDDAIPENPCTWQDVADGEDCAMEHIYGASFVASKWLKTMPCAEGIEDCDMPGDLTAPSNRPEAAKHDVDVMDFLGLKRAIHLGKVGKNKELKP